MLNDKKIAFIICTNNERWYNECVLYLSGLELPEDFEADVLQITDAKSMASGYNEGMHASDAKYKIYLHQDVFIIRTDFILRVIEAFQEHPEVGIMGVLGTDRIVTSGSYWDNWTSGQVYALNPLQGFCLRGGNTEQQLTSAVALDGMILMTQYDIEWREELFNGWDFYDISQCFEFFRKDYVAAVFHEDTNSCLHDCGYSKIEKYNKSREIFCEEYAEYGFQYTGKLETETECEKQLPVSFTDELNVLLSTDISQAEAYVEQAYSEYEKDNLVATLKVIFDIHKREQQANSDVSFIDKNVTWEALIDKYQKYKFMVRRIEFGITDDAAKELYSELKNGIISLELIEEIICHCCYNGDIVMTALEKELESEKNKKEGNKEKKMPKVSVLLPAYNHENFIEECVESVLNQTYKNIEFIVGDDASTDGTVEKLMKYQEQIDEIHLFDENNGGISGFLGERCSGEYIAVINSDDAWYPDKLEKQIQVLEENPNVVACFTWCDLVDEDGNVLDKDNHFNVTNRSKEEWFNYFYFNGNCMAHASMLIRKEIYFLYREKHINMFRQLPDFYMWIRMVQKYDVVMLEEKLTRIRVVNTEERINVSAATRDNLLRHFNEESYIWYAEISKMESNYFVQTFKEQMIDKHSSAPVEILCEKLFILLNAKVEYCKIAAFFFYYDHFAEMKEVLSNKYGFVDKDMHQLVCKIGPGKYIS